MIALIFIKKLSARLTYCKHHQTVLCVHGALEALSDNGELPNADLRVEAVRCYDKFPDGRISLNK